MSFLLVFVRPSQVENYWRLDVASISACCGRLVSCALFEQPSSYSLGSARKRRSATTDAYQPVVINTHSAISFPPNPPRSESAQKWADEKLLHFRLHDCGAKLFCGRRPQGPAISIFLDGGELYV